MPDADAVSRHERPLRASGSEALAAARAVTPAEVRLLGPLMAARRLPARLIGRPVSRFAGAPVLDLLAQDGFRVLVDDPEREVVIAAIGQPHRLAGGRMAPVRDRIGFRTFTEPGFVKMAAAVWVDASPEGVRLVTETRCRATDTRTARAFGRYWRVIAPFSGLVRRGWLAAAERRVSEADRSIRRPMPAVPAPPGSAPDPSR